MRDAFTCDATRNERFREYLRRSLARVRGEQGRGRRASGEIARGAAWAYCNSGAETARGFDAGVRSA